LEVATIRADAPTSRWLDGVTAALVRPDGHIAWLTTGEEDDARSLRTSVERWVSVPRGVPKLSLSASRIG
jgi:hypothetical protein